jgi:hypothetical protein
MTKLKREELQKGFAIYLRNFSEQIPVTIIPKEFRTTKITVTTIHRYCIRVLEENSEPEKIEKIKVFFVLSKGNVSLDKVLLELERSVENKAKSIAKIFQGITVAPKEITLSFAAFLINSPIQTLEEFRQWKELHSKDKTLELENKFELEKISPEIAEKETEIAEKETEITEKETKIAEKETEKAEKETEKAEKETEKAEIEKPKIGFWKKYFKEISIAASLLLLVTFSYKYYTMLSYVDTQKEKLAYIEQITFKPVVADSNFRENTPISKNTDFDSTNNKAGEEKITNPLSFHTNNIYNGKFLYSSEKWNFETNTEGEDMNSKYGEPYRENLKSVVNMPTNIPTIANKNMQIRFNIKNSSGKTLYIDNVKLEKIATYHLDTKKVKWSNWITQKAGEQKYKVTLTHTSTIIPILDFKEVTNNQAQHFSLEIDGDASCENYIYNFRLVISANDGNGNRYNVVSDKTYYLGFLDTL